MEGGAARHETRIVPAARSRRSARCADASIDSSPSVMRRSLGILQSGAGEPAWNMALDEALLVTSATRGYAVLRHYSWNQPAATFGYFQHHGEVERATLLRPLLRRPTGGGIVPPDRDWT